MLSKRLISGLKSLVVPRGPTYLTISVVQQCALWALNVEASGSIPGRTNLRGELFEIGTALGVLVWLSGTL